MKLSKTERKEAMNIIKRVDARLTSADRSEEIEAWNDVKLTKQALSALSIERAVMDYFK